MREIDRVEAEELFAGNEPIASEFCHDDEAAWVVLILTNYYLLIIRYDLGSMEKSYYMKDFLVSRDRRAADPADDPMARLWFLEEEVQEALEKT